jgi:tetratricopeptide (TPR) repeat protein
MELRSVTAHLTKPFCILAGAGVSYSPPASLPTALDVLASLFSTLPIPKTDRDILLNALSPEWSDGLGYYDFLRFEQVVEALEYCGDLHIKLLHRIVQDTLPNKNHYQLARLLNAGHRILTTNFDCLIEQACDDLGIPYTVLVSNKDYEDYMQHATEVVNPIFKLHGTISTDSFDVDAISVTIQSVISERNKMASKWAAVDEELSKRDLMVIGYSGSDDFDVMQSIRFALQKLLWVQHGATDTPIAWCMTQDQAPRDLGIDKKLHWFLCRMFGDFKYTGRVKRTREDVLVVRMPTSHILDELLDHQVAIDSDRMRPTVITGNKLLSEHTMPIFTGKESPQSLFFVGMLFRNVGLFDRAMEYLSRAIDDSWGSVDMRITSRVHATIAQIWLEREQWDKAAIHMDKVLSLGNEVSTRHWIDVLNLMEFSYRLGIPNAIDEDFFDLLGVKDWLTLRQQTHLKRATHIWEAERLLNTGMETEALKHVLEFFKDDLFPFELQEKADAHFLYRKINRAHYWRQINAGRSENVARIESETFTEQMVLSDVCDTFEYLQQKNKWAETMFLQAEEHLLHGWPEWCAEAAMVAAKIYEKIGNPLGYARCNSLLEHCAEIEKGGTYENFYKPEIIDEIQGNGEDVEFYCPRCRTFVQFRFQHCWKCGWFSESAPQSKTDASTDPEERARCLHELFIRIGKSMLNFD